MVLTRSTDTGVGPCVNERAAVANNLHADVAVSIHADGPPGGSGFAVDTPGGGGELRSRTTPAIIGPSDALSTDLRNAFKSATGLAPANYTGQDGIVYRSDLGGTNLSTVPKVFIECANMRNAHDAARGAEPGVAPERGDQGIAQGIEAYLEAAERT